MNTIFNENLIKTLSKLTFIAVIFSFSGLLSAAQVSGLYQSDVLVSSQTAEERQEAFNLALKEVLVRVSGKASVLENEALMSVANQPDQLVQKFSYEKAVQDNQAFTLMTASVSEQNQQGVNAGLYRINIVFSRLAVSQALKKYGEPIWGSNRPSVLIWLASDDKGRRTVLSSAAETSVSEAIKKAAKVRGVPIYLPVMDLEDEANASSSDIWGLFIDSLHDASARYAADSMVVARLRQGSGNNWSGQWVFDLKGFVYRGDIKEQALDDSAMLMVGSIADILAERYAILGGESSLNSEVELEISDIKTMEDYVSVTRYIQSLPPVNKAQLNWVKGEKVRFTISLNGYLEQLLQHIELDTKLLEEVSQSFNADDSAKLYYRWTRLNGSQ
ncbi:DUF2066 domain-containing protein [Alkalimarinus sediminis]|uniref:DUF2066 domain-containing protein n=1 Tax=Alkalimarinus sediminis TaxID=1632866 RepID=A0A9E8KNJ3_9ALTE|nr:DUF2066 domain-containing protein [Alkalimarinus sediminis]UZW73295.1 DUF2066 domain-containing protein [Alkalimarinus sediminis]